MGVRILGDGTSCSGTTCQLTVIVTFLWQLIHHQQIKQTVIWLTSGH